MILKRIALIVAGTWMLLAAAPLAAQDLFRTEKTILESGHALPERGYLVAEFQEDLIPEIPGPETMVRTYEDGRGDRVREFLINGALFQIEVNPYSALPYLLLDEDGDGIFEAMMMGASGRLIIPLWAMDRGVPKPQSDR